MNRIQKYVTIGALLVAGTIVALGGYIRLWEYRQPKQQMDSRKVLSIEPYSSHNDLHWTSRGYRLRIEGENRVIDFPLKNWDSTVKDGDSVDLVVRKSFFGNELDGISIDDHK